MTHKPSWRKPAGIALILLLILFWAGLVAALSGTVGEWPVLVQAPFYLFMGIAWIMPLKPLIRWMETGTWSRAGNDPPADRMPPRRAGSD